MSLIKNLFKSISQPMVNKSKGAYGERLVDSKLNPWFFGKVEHRQINNLILMDDNGKSHQIDHVEIRQNGIFCIETKNYIGWIFGSENQDKWTQTLYTGEKNQFINPLKQNKSHIYHMRKVLGDNYKINSLVVMVQDNSDKLNIPNVIDLSDLKNYLKDFDNGVSYTIEQMDEIYNKLLSASVKMSDKQHVKNIKKTQEELQQGICPRCGGKLVERDGKYGKFFGCSNFPNCKFILKDQVNS